MVYNPQARLLASHMRPDFTSRARKKTNKQKHFRRDGVRDKQEPSLGQMGPLPGTKWDPSLGQTGLSLFNSTVKSPFCPVCPWDRWGFVPGTIVPQGPSEKCLCVFCLLFFLLPEQGASRVAILPALPFVQNHSGNSSKIIFYLYLSLLYHPNQENYQPPLNFFFGTVAGYQSPNNSRRPFCRYR